MVGQRRSRCRECRLLVAGDDDPRARGSEPVTVGVVCRPAHDDDRLGVTREHTSLRRGPPTGVKDDTRRLRRTIRLAAAAAARARVEPQSGVVREDRADTDRHRVRLGADLVDAVEVVRPGDTDLFALPGGELAVGGDGGVDVDVHAQVPIGVFWSTSISTWTASWNSR